MPLLSDAFDLIRVINLPDRKDRYRELMQQFKVLGLKLTPGRVEIYVATRPTTLAGFPNLGSHGCFLSHLEILRDARDRCVESVLVMEDDCEVLPHHVAAIGEIAASLRARAWGFCYLGHVEPLPELKEGSQPRLVEFAGPLKTTHLYAVQKSALPALVEYLEDCLVRPPGDPIGGPMHVDGALSLFRAAHSELLTLIAQPALASQRASRSDITFRSFEQVPGLKQAMNVARKIRRSAGRIRA
jgi:hypothetical protein